MKILFLLLAMCSLSPLVSFAQKEPPKELKPAMGISVLSIIGATAASNEVEKLKEAPRQEILGTTRKTSGFQLSQNEIKQLEKMVASGDEVELTLANKNHERLKTIKLSKAKLQDFDQLIRKAQAGGYSITKIGKIPASRFIKLLVYGSLQKILGVLAAGSALFAVSDHVSTKKSVFNSGRTTEDKKAPENSSSEQQKSNSRLGKRE